jgi:hypothetical protein
VVVVEVVFKKLVILVVQEVEELQQIQVLYMLGEQEILRQ